MKNLESRIEKISHTTIISKTFDAKTERGFDVVITAYRKVIDVTSSPFNSRIYFGVSFKGQEFGHNDMDKQSLFDAIKVINKWGNKI